MTGRRLAGVLLPWQDRQRAHIAEAFDLAPEIISQIVALDAQGPTQAHIATTVGVSRISVRQVLRKRAAAQLAAPASHTSQSAGDTDSGDTSSNADSSDHGCGPEQLQAAPAATPHTSERQAARYGQLEQATPVFTRGRRLPLAGLLLALPGLETTGLFHIAKTTCGRQRETTWTGYVAC